jgi:uncharacterized protein (DUF1697 family)
MAKYVAFLRGVNVGGRVIKMAELKTCFEKAGFKDVKTVLQSGNVIFESAKKQPALKSEIEKLLTKTFNYPAKAQVYSLDRLARIVKDYPFASQDDYHSYVIFLENGLEKDLVADVSQLDKKLEQIKSGQGVVYWRVQKGMTLKSHFAKLLTKSKYKDFNTNRNLNTLQKILSV